jgi:septum formation protein
MTVWRGAMPLVLASQSHARRTLLANAGIACETIPADIDERAVQLKSGLKLPSEIATRLALEKARAVAASRPGRVVLGADQTLALGNQLFNKPGNRAVAAEQLRLLSSQTHALHSAFALVGHGEAPVVGVAVARMTMRPLSDAAIDAYLDAAANAVTTTVGAYQLEGLGVHLFERIEGDHFTILGLPLLALLPVLRDKGLIAL